MMKRLLLVVALAGIFFTRPVSAQIAREDAVWARTAPAGSIVLDGKLDEPAWAKAEQLKIQYGKPGKLPTSGWRSEFQPDAYTDTTNATVKFLVVGNQLYLGFYIPDSSIGGTQDWARWDAILMSVKDRTSAGRPAAAAEFFYTFWLAGLPNTTPVVGAQPRFVGTFGNFSDTTRTPEQRATWDAVTTFKGTSNDAGRDTSWTVEMRIDLGKLGYDVTKAQGDIAEICFSIWDCDYLFEGVPGRISTTRTHWQSPWGNANANNVGRVYSRPDITINTTTLPVPDPDGVVPNMQNYAEPLIDGNLNETEWNQAYTFNIAWGDTMLRKSYPTVGPEMSGQYQPMLNNNPLAPVLDPSFGKIKAFFKGNYLYLGADINDQLVQGTEVFDKIDGIGFIIGDRVAKNAEETMEFRYLRLSFGMDGLMKAGDYLPGLVDSGKAFFGSKLKGATTVNNNTDVDLGYTVEMKIDLTALGYAPNLGDRALFMGVMLADGDSFDDSLANYGTRTWWFREHAGGPATTWLVLNPNPAVGVEDNLISLMPTSIHLFGNYPNPFNPATKIKYYIPDAGEVNLSIYNSLGQLVTANKSVERGSGVYEYSFDASHLASGVYFYRVDLTSSVSGKSFSSVTGKMILMK